MKTRTKKYLKTFCLRKLIIGKVNHAQISFIKEVMSINYLVCTQNYPVTL